MPSKLEVLNRSHFHTALLATIPACSCPLPVYMYVVFMLRAVYELLRKKTVVSSRAVDMYFVSLFSLFPLWVMAGYK